MNISSFDLNISSEEKVIVAMSGGVDSSFTAYLAKHSAKEVIGVTLKMFDNEDANYDDAKRVAEELGIKWYLADYSKEFNEYIISYFIREYKYGRTPNPCSRCNKLAKTVFLHNEMVKNNATKIITGHYAVMKELNGYPIISKGLDKDKDQSYYLALIEEEYLKYLRFPLGSFKKKDIRVFAKEIGLSVAEKKDSQDICFIEGSNYRDFLANYLKKVITGNFILNGEIVGQNKGIHNYTVGQRKGLDISHSEPIYVKSIDSKTGDVYLTTKEDIGEETVRLIECNFHPASKTIFNGLAKVRYRMTEEPCTVEKLPDNKAQILFENKQFAPASGQTVAIYIDDMLIGGGVIE